jgi:Zn-dependent metalloprotease
MKAPGTAYDDKVLGKDPQPADMSGYVKTADDNGGVHLNSGIPNHAFYLAAIALGGNAWERAGQIWYDAVVGGSLPATSDFARFAAETTDAAVSRYGANSAEQRAVSTAWQKVGVQ